MKHGSDKSSHLGMKALLISLIALHIPSLAFTVDFDCRTVLTLLTHHLQKGSIGLTDHPLRDFESEISGKLGTPINTIDKHNPNSLSGFEDDIIDLFRVAPELRSIEAFKKKWGLSEEQAFDILTYYGTRVFHEEPLVVGTPHEVFGRLQQVSRFHFLAFPSQGPALHYQYYLFNVTKLSVPEMARQLGVSEGQVYSELSQLQISIVAEFSTPVGKHNSTIQSNLAKLTSKASDVRILEDSTKLDVATRLVQKGVSTDDAAQVLGVGRSAFEFVLHHTGARGRGVTWSRVLNYEGHPQIEDQLLVTFFNQGLSHLEIAERLNQLAGITSPGHPDIRTEGAVRHRLNLLGVVHVRPRTSEPSVYDPRYGYLKFNGNLVPTAVTKFVVDHHDRSNSWIAAQVGVTEGALSSFLSRHHIVRGGGTQTPRIRQDNELLDRYASQRWAVEKVVAWLRSNPDTLLDRTKFGRGANQIPLEWDRLFGVSHYREGGTDWHRRIFSNPDEGLIAIKQASKNAGVPFSLVKMRIKNSSDKMRSLWQEESVDLYLDWYLANGRTPGSSDFGTTGKKLPFGSTRFYGTGSYVEGKPNHAGRIFSSTSEAIVAIKKRAIERNIPFSALEIKNIKRLSDELREIRKQEAVDRYLDWMVKNGGAMPEQYDFGTGEGKLGFLHIQFFATSNYAPGAPHGEARIFDNPSEAILAISNGARERKINFRAIDVNTSGLKPSEELRDRWQEESLDLITSWMKEQGVSKITQKNFGSKDDQIPLRFSRFLGSSEYREGGKQYDYRIFSSSSEALVALKKYGKSKAVEISLLDFKVDSPSKELIEETRSEAISRYISWLESNPGKVPQRTYDFHFKENGVLLNADRFWGRGQYRDGQPNSKSRLFSSKVEALQAVSTELQQRAELDPTRKKEFESMILSIEKTIDLEEL